MGALRVFTATQDGKTGLRTFELKNLRKSTKSTDNFDILAL